MHRRSSLLASIIALLSSTLLAAPHHLRQADTLSSLPPGTTLPVSLHGALRAGASQPGKAILARTTQRILLPGSEYLPAGVEVLGSVTLSDANPPGVLTLRFTQLRFKQQTLPIAVRALAIANFVAVSDTAHPASGSTDRGNSNPASWTTQQVGGDQVVRSGWSGPVVNTSTQTVGTADFYGVYALPHSPLEPPRAMGVFSTSAHGLYGFDTDCTLDSPAAEIAIRCRESTPLLRDGDNLLLEVVPSRVSPAQP